MGNPMVKTWCDGRHAWGSARGCGWGFKFFLETCVRTWEMPISLDMYNLQVFWHTSKFSKRMFAN